MPNICFFEMAIGGYYSAVDEFVKIMQNDYDKIHFYRIFEAYPYGETTYGLYKKIYISGNCAWSIASCMLSYREPLVQNREIKINQFTGYYYDADMYECIKNLYEHKMVQFLGTNLLEQTRRLGLTVEIYSNESGMSFCEHIKALPNGTYAYNKEGYYHEYYFGDVETYKDYLEEYCIDDPSTLPFDEEEFEMYKECGQEYEAESEFVFEDTIPTKPKYLGHNLFYKLHGSKFDK